MGHLIAGTEISIPASTSIPYPILSYPILSPLSLYSAIDTKIAPRYKPRRYTATAVLLLSWALEFLPIPASLKSEHSSAQAPAQREYKSSGNHCAALSSLLCAIKSDCSPLATSSRTNCRIADAQQTLIL